MARALALECHHDMAMASLVDYPVHSAKLNAGGVLLRQGLDDVFAVVLKGGEGMCELSLLHFACLGDILPRPIGPTRCRSFSRCIAHVPCGFVSLFEKSRKAGIIMEVWGCEQGTQNKSNTSRCVVLRGWHPLFVVLEKANVR
jgi:hypothetical protein